jgi:hypothetical protein
MVPLVMVDVKVRNDPQFPSDSPPPSREGIILSPPFPVLCAVLEQVDMGRVGRSVAKVWIGSHDRVDGFHRDLKKTCGHELCLHASVVPEQGAIVWTV